MAMAGNGGAARPAMPYSYHLYFDPALKNYYLNIQLVQKPVPSRSVLQIPPGQPAGRGNRDAYVRKP